MRRFALLCATSLLHMSTAHAERLDVARLFAAPDLSGPRLQSPKFSPDGRYVTFLRGKQEDKNQLDLWAADTRTGATKLLVDSNVLEPHPQVLSAEEAARRERQRTAALHGIVEYDFSPDGQKLLIPLGGDFYVYDLGKKSDPVSRLTQTPAYETDARFSPRGRYVSFIRDQNIVAIDLASGREFALTTDGQGLVQNGVAEFVAQEEMDRDTGYWWSPDESKVAYTQIDDSPVEEVERVEIEAAGAKVVKQRYPAAGTPNTRVVIKVVNVQTLERRDLSLDDNSGESDIYIPRIAWLPNSKELAVERESRDQRKLDLIKIDTANGTATQLLSETSASWINLNDDLYFLKSRPEFIWGSERSGFHHLYLYGTDGHLIRPLTQGNWVITGEGLKNGSLSVDERRRKLYFLANEKTPLEQHVYSTSLDTKDASRVARISTEDGWHNARFASNGIYLDSWSSPDVPPSSSLRNSSGAVTHWLIVAVAVSQQSMYP